MFLDSTCFRLKLKHKGNEILLLWLGEFERKNQVEELYRIV
jgi:hypothetical protein